MALTRNFKKTIVARVERDPGFARALLDEAATLFLSGDPATARLVLRDLVNSTLGFEKLANVTAMPGKSLHRMLPIVASAATGKGQWHASADQQGHACDAAKLGALHSNSQKNKN